MKARPAFSTFPIKLSSVLFALVVGVAWVTALPARADDRPRADDVRKLREEGKILPMEEILARSRTAQPGQVVEVELERGGNRYTYEVKLIDDANRVHKLELDAATGELLSRKTR